MPLPTLLHQPFVFLNLLWILIASCDNKKRNIPFPDDETTFAKPVSKPFHFATPVKLEWKQDSSSKTAPVEQGFDFSSLPSRALDFGDFKTMPAAPEEIAFDWNSLPDTAFDIDQLKEEPLLVQTYLLPEPEIIPTAFPKVKPGTTTGILTLGFNEGLPSMQIDELLEDRHGMIWFICSGKLYRYNGEYTEHFIINERTNLIKLTEDRSGKIWIGTDQGHGLYVLDIKAGIIRHATIPYNIAQIVEDHRGLFWLGSIYGGLFIVDWNKKTIKNFRKYPGYVFKNTVEDIVEDRHQRMWLACADGIRIFTPADQRLKFMSKAQGLHFDKYFSIKEDASGRIWAGPDYDYAGINVIYPDSGKIQYLGVKQGVYKPGLTTVSDDQQNIYIAADSVIFVIDKNLEKIKRIETNERYSDIWVGHLIYDRAGQFWLGTRAGGINILATKGLLPRHLSKPQGLSGIAIAGMAEDDQGRVWIGGTVDYTSSRLKGWLNLIDSARDRVVDLTPAISTNFSFAIAIALDQQKRTWTGLYGIGAMRFDFKKNKILTIGEAQGLERSVNCLLVARDGMVWAGTDSGITMILPESGKTRHLQQFPGTAPDPVICVLQDLNNNIWFGTPNYGLYMIDSSLTMIHHFGTGEGLTHNDVESLAEDAEGRIWIATEKGVNVIEKNQKNYFVLAKEEGLIESNTYTLLRAGKSMYAGTSKGLSKITPREKFSSTRAGNETPWEISSYNKAQGIIYTDFNSNSSLYTKRREAWFGADFKAVTVLTNLVEDKTVFPVSITGIGLFEKRLTFSQKELIEKGLGPTDTLYISAKDTFYLSQHVPEDTGYLQKNQIHWDSLTGPFKLPVNLQLPWQQNFINFHFMVMPFSNLEQRRYRYILEGIDRNWSAVTNKPFSENYRDLSPGSYTFKVSSMGTNKIWSTPTEFSFRILPPWWATWWAYALYGIVFVFMISWYVKYRSANLKRMNIVLEEKVSHRTEELKLSLEELKSTQSQLIQSEKMASLGQLTAGIAHEIQNPLNFVNNFSEVNKELLVELGQVIEAGNYDEAKSIAKDVIKNEEKINLHGKRADSIVKGMLEHSRANSGEKQPTDINALADEYLKLAYHGWRGKDKLFNAVMIKDFDVTLSADETGNGKINIPSQEIGRVLLNLYNNAIYAVREKKTQQKEDYEPTVSVSTKKTGNKTQGYQATIIVKDNGNGIAPGIVEKIFQPFYTTKPTGQGTGLGLSLSYDIIKAIGGEIKVNSEPGEWTAFTVSFPV